MCLAWNTNGVHAVNVLPSPRRTCYPGAEVLLAWRMSVYMTENNFFKKVLALAFMISSRAPSSAWIVWCTRDVRARLRDEEHVWWQQA